MATTTTSRSSASSRATCPVTAVLPTRLPVPTIDSDGSGNGASGGGSKRKSGPTYGSPSASTRLATRSRSRGPSTGSSERSITTSGSSSATAGSSESPPGRRPPRRREASRCRPPARARPPRRAAPPARRAPRGRSARRRRWREPSSRPRRDLVLDPRRVLLERPRLGRELDDPLLPVERVLAPDVDVALVDLDHVVTGARFAPEPHRGDRAGVDDEQVLQPPGVGHVLVAREDEVDARALQALDAVAGVVDDVALAARARDGEQVVVQDEDLQV